MKSLKLISMFFVALIFTMSAQAVQYCAAYGNTYEFNMTPTSETVISSVPQDLGGANSSRYYFDANAEGVTTWWYYNDGFNWRIQYQAVSYAKLANPQLMVDLVAAKTATDPKAAMIAFESKYVDTLITEPAMTKIWCPSWAKIVAGTPPPVPYIVKPAPGYALRATYPWTKAGGRGAKSNGTIAITTGGKPTPCYPANVRTVENGVVYGSTKAVPAGTTTATITGCSPA